MHVRRKDKDQQDTSLKYQTLTFDRKLAGYRLVYLPRNDYLHEFFYQA